MRDRTADLLRAKQALSQLSYGPLRTRNFRFRIRNRKSYKTHLCKFPTQIHEDLVGLGRLELPTSPLSGVRSNQLSYRPKRGLTTAS